MPNQIFSLSSVVIWQGCMRHVLWCVEFVTDVRERLGAALLELLLCTNFFLCDFQSNDRRWVVYSPYDAGFGHYQ